MTPTPRKENKPTALSGFDHNKPDTFNTQSILARIQDYLGNGGLFNPEMMEHDKVRQLIMDCRDELALSLIPTTVDAVEREEWRQEKEKLETQLSMLRLMGQELSEAWNEAACCDDIPLDRPLAKFIGNLCRQRDALRKAVSLIENKVKQCVSDTAELNRQVTLNRENWRIDAEEKDRTISKLTKERDSALAQLKEVKDVDCPIHKMDTWLISKNVCGRCLLESQLSTLRKDKENIQRCLGFFASVIKSGEAWTSTCQTEYDTAINR